MTEKLPAAERIAILTNRLRNLRDGRGVYLRPYDRKIAIQSAEEALAQAISDVSGGSCA